MLSVFFGLILDIIIRIESYCCVLKNEKVFFTKKKV
ncbi:MAG: hypothetical protein RL757_2876 [Bacteroidota bacterium]|jgi:hypothetical protein